MQSKLKRHWYNLLNLYLHRKILFTCYIYQNFTLHFQNPFLCQFTLFILNSFFSSPDKPLISNGRKEKYPNVNTLATQQNIFNLFIKSYVASPLLYIIVSSVEQNKHATKYYYNIY